MKRIARRLAGIALASLFLLSGLFAVGCEQQTPGVTDQPPPKGGPPKNGRRPPGEVSSGATR